MRLPVTCCCPIFLFSVLILFSIPNPRSSCFSFRNWILRMGQCCHLFPSVPCEILGKVFHASNSSPSLFLPSFEEELLRNLLRCRWNQDGAGRAKLIIARGAPSLLSFWLYRAPGNQNPCRDTSAAELWAMGFPQSCSPPGLSDSR